MSLWIAVDPDGYATAHNSRPHKSKTEDGWTWWSNYEGGIDIRPEQKRPTPYMGVKPGECKRVKGIVV